jgi:glycosyltransferase involved in cell wall biosynthesis
VPTGTSDRVIEELGAALVRLLEDPALRTRMAGAARQRAIDSFSWKAKRAFVRSIYRDILFNRLPGTVGQMMLDRGHRGD